MNKIIQCGKHAYNNVELHKHADYELIFTLSGQGKLIDIFTSNSIDYETSELLIVPPNHQHTNTSNTGFSNIYLQLQTLEFNFIDIKKIKDSNSFVLKNCFEQIYYYFNIDNLDNQNSTNASPILNNLSTLLATCINTFANSDPQYSPLIEKIRQNILKHYLDADFNLSMTLDKEKPCSEYLRKLFKKETGTTPLQYLLDLRLNYAAKLLKTNGKNETISQIANECGFLDTYYFSRMFKKHMNLSPSIFKLLPTEDN